ncbi:DUF6035 family protein [Polaribacter sp. IC073]|uniref:DUF6035 family protein n=1 Tax=Polaribacter sp. IC073 TaxID=2508540 RepID=UPI0011BEE71D|nr:DUF6035 family protein [Polaribacter sp. IC073]TXD49195.1 hypothetical protein ES045_03775 [Polaribacter sp. IC073]
MENIKSIRTIKSVLNKKTGQEIIADEFFNKSEPEIWDYRIRLQQVFQKLKKPLLVCYICGQNVKINGGIGTNKILHFSHFKDSEICPLKTDSLIDRADLLRAKYNGAKESLLHKETKNLIKDFLLLEKLTTGNITYVETEKVKKSITNYSKWKKPDITSIYKGLDLVFEIQLSTTFLSVIIDRENFYKENKTYIIWIFKDFELKKSKQRFTDKDIFYSNNRNVFVLDEEAIIQSKKNKELVLLCYWEEPKIINNKIVYTWSNNYVNLNDLTYDKENFKVFYFNFNKEEEILKKELEKKRQTAILENNREEIKNNNQNYINTKFKENYNIRRRNHLLQYEEDFINRNNEFYNRLFNNNVISKFKKNFLLPKFELQNNIYNYFERYHNISVMDKSFINKEFLIELESNNSKGDESIFYYLTQTVFYIKFIEHHKEEYFPRYNLKDIVKHNKKLFTILSFKYNLILGFNYKQFSQLVNLYFNPKSAYYNYRAIIVFGIKFYYPGGFEAFYKVEDKKGALKLKIDDYIEVNQQEGITKMKNEPELSNLIEIIFPKISFHSYI